MPDPGMRLAPHTIGPQQAKEGVSPMFNGEKEQEPSKGQEPPIEALRALIYRAALDAVQGSDEIRAIVAQLQRAGHRIRVDVCAAVRCAPPDWIAAERVARQRRWCPRCSQKDNPFYLRGRIVRERILASGDREVIEGPQVRFACSLCGYGEVEPIGPVGGGES